MKSNYASTTFKNKVLAVSTSFMIAITGLTLLSASTDTFASKEKRIERKLKKAEKQIEKGKYDKANRTMDKAERIMKKQ